MVGESFGIWYYEPNVMASLIVLVSGGLLGYIHKAVNNAIHQTPLRS